MEELTKEPLWFGPGSPAWAVVGRRVRLPHCFGVWPLIVALRRAGETNKNKPGCS